MTVAVTNEAAHSTIL